MLLPSQFERGGHKTIPSPVFVQQDMCFSLSIVDAFLSLKVHDQHMTLLCQVAVKQETVTAFIV